MIDEIKRYMVFINSVILNAKHVPVRDDAHHTERCTELSGFIYRAIESANSITPNKYLFQLIRFLTQLGLNYNERKFLGADDCFKLAEQSFNDCAEFFGEKS